LLSEILTPVLEFISNPYLIIIILTFLPFLELRASIPYGIFATEINIFIVIALAVISNIILSPLLYLFLDKFIHLLFFFKPFKKWYHNKLEKAQKKIKPKVEKYGILGLSIFIGIPLPGSGVYTGALAAYIMNLGYKKFLYASIIGVLIAGFAVTIISLLALSGFDFLSNIFLKQI
jgi:uncharacterized membrane protein